MKFLSFLALFFMSFTIQACMVQPEGLGEKHILQFQYLLIGSVILFPLIFITRYMNDKRRMWVPTLAVLGFGYLPFTSYILEYAGLSGFGGACGHPGIVLTGKILLTGLSVIFIYELFKYIIARRKL